MEFGLELRHVTSCSRSDLSTVGHGATQIRGVRDSHMICTAGKVAEGYKNCAEYENLAGHGGSPFRGGLKPPEFIDSSVGPMWM